MTLRKNYLTAELIAAATDRPHNRVQHRLRQFYDCDYLRRYHPPHEQIGGSKKVVYLLDREGAKILTEQLGETVKVNRNFDPDSYHPFMEHTLLTNWFRVLVNAACRERNNIEIPYQYPDDSFSIRFKYPGYKSEFTIEPDFFFGLRNGNGQVSNFFVEVQRPTRKTKESSRQQKKSVRRKMLAYHLFWKSRAYRDLRDDFKEVSNWSNMRVLVLTETGDGEYQNLMNLPKKIDERGNGLRLFWFARRSSFRIDRPVTLSNHVWQTSVDFNKRQSLLT